MTNGYLSAIESFTATKVSGCPWRAFSDPFVLRVVEAHGFLEDGAMQWARPNPSNRLVEGVGFYKAALSRVYAKQLDEERDRRKREAAAAEAKAARR